MKILTSFNYRLAEAVEASTDVRKRGMMGFYSNLLTKNIALGGSLDSAVSAYTVGSSRNTSLLQSERSNETIPGELTDMKGASAQKSAVMNQMEQKPASSLELNSMPSVENHAVQEEAPQQSPVSYCSSTCIALLS